MVTMRGSGNEREKLDDRIEPEAGEQAGLPERGDGTEPRGVYGIARRSGGWLANVQIVRAGITPLIFSWAHCYFRLESMRICCMLPSGRRWGAMLGPFMAVLRLPRVKSTYDSEVKQDGYERRALLTTRRC